MNSEIKEIKVEGYTIRYDGTKAIINHEADGVVHSTEGAIEAVEWCLAQVIANSKETLEEYVNAVEAVQTPIQIAGKTLYRRGRDKGENAWFILSPDGKIDRITYEEPDADGTWESVKKAALAEEIEARREARRATEALQEEAREAFYKEAARAVDEIATIDIPKITMSQPSRYDDKYELPSEGWQTVRDDEAYEADYREWAAQVEVHKVARHAWLDMDSFNCTLADTIKIGIPRRGYNIYAQGDLLTETYTDSYRIGSKEMLVTKKGEVLPTIETFPLNTKVTVKKWDKHDIVVVPQKHSRHEDKGWYFEVFTWRDDSWGWRDADITLSYQVERDYDARIATYTPEWSVRNIPSDANDFRRLTQIRKLLNVIELYTAAWESESNEFTEEF